jgi:hypothetical protein
MKKPFVLHPILLSILPTVSLLSFNINDVGLGSAVRPLVLSLVGCGIVWLIAQKVVGNWHHSGLVTSLFLILFFSYGHVFTGIVHPATGLLFAKIGLVGRHDVLLLVWLGLFILGVRVIGRLKRQRLELTRIFNVIAIASAVMPLFTIISHEIQLSRPWPRDIPALAGESSPEPTSNPDIYYLVLDGYARSDILADIYDYDNSSFLGYLENKGFFVADQSQSNYMQTSLSLASSLNMTFLDFLPERIGQNTDDRTPLARLVRSSEVRRVLEARGYEIVAFETGYRLTELENADRYLRSPGNRANILERLLMETSGFIAVQELFNRMGCDPIYLGYRAHRERIKFVFSTLPDLAEQSGPTLVFVHLILPHPPFVFGPNGEELSEQRPFLILDGDAFPGTPSEYLAGYRGQVTFANRMLEETLTEILASSETPPIIVLQGDHGPGSGLDWDSYQDTNLLERTSILNAIYLPDVEGSELLYEDISPVNTFRVIFNHYFDMDYALLDDRAYYSTWDQPYRFMLVEE